MSTRKVTIDADDGWVDLETAATPALVQGKGYQFTFEEEIPVKVREDYPAVVPDASVIDGHPAGARRDPLPFQRPERR